MTRLNPRIDRPLPAPRSSTFVFLLAVVPPIAAFVAVLLAIAIAAWPRPAHAETPAMISLMNAKLARYVHRTGKCLGADEQLATYYWKGQRVACGGRFDPDGLTAASRTLPCGTRLTVRNPSNDRQVVVTVRDRGPYTIAKLDLSRGAARALGMVTSIYVCVSKE